MFTSIVVKKDQPIFQTRAMGTGTRSTFFPEEEWNDSRYGTYEEKEMRRNIFVHILIQFSILVTDWLMTRGKREKSHLVMSALRETPGGAVTFGPLSNDPCRG